MSGTMSAKSLVCLTCPAITAWVDARVLQQADALAQLAERHPVQAGRGRLRAASSASSGNASSLMAMTVTSWPAPPGRVEHQKGKAAVAGDET